MGEGTLSETMEAAMGTNRGRASEMKPVSHNNKRSKAGKKARNKKKSIRRHIFRKDARPAIRLHKKLYKWGSRKSRTSGLVSPRQDDVQTRGPSKKTGLHQRKTRQECWTKASNPKTYELMINKIKKKTKKAFEKVRSTRFREAEMDDHDHDNHNII